MSDWFSTRLGHYAFIDFETTGLNPACDEVVEVGVVFVDDGRVTEQLTRLFRPSAPLPSTVVKLTGLTDAMLEKAPSFASFRDELIGRLEGRVVVAHNADFERAFLKGALPQRDFLDTCELFHWLHPELPSHSLESLVVWTQVAAAATHRALRDAQDTLEVMRRILNAVVQDDRVDDVRDLLAALDDDSGAEPSTAAVALLRDVFEGCKAHPSALRLTPTTTFLPAPLSRQKKEGAPKRRDSAQAAVRKWLGPEGALEKADAHFTFRASQLKLSQAMAQTLTSGERAAFEAATGTGKSLAYAGAAAAVAAKTGERTLISTATRALQDQLVQRELPRLHDATDGAFSFAVLKGQTNYLCRRKTLAATEGPGEGTPSDRSARAYLRAFMRRSPDGDLDSLSHWFLRKHPQTEVLVARSRSESATTLGERCPHYHRCFFHSAVHHAQSAQVLVANHALTLRWPPRYPEATHLVVDEAHDLEDAATSAHTQKLSLDDVRRWAQGARRILAQATAWLENETQARLSASIDEGLEALNLAAAPLRAFASPDLWATRAERRVSEKVLGERSWVVAREALRRLRRALAEWSQALSVIKTGATKVPLGFDRDLGGLNEAVARADSVLAAFVALPLPHMCQSVEWRQGEWALCLAPIDVQSHVAQAMERFSGVILTSATLGLGPGKPWVLSRLGLDHGPQPFSFSRFGFSASKDSRSHVVLVRDAPLASSEHFAPWAGEAITHLARLLGGRVLGLFSSAERLAAVAAVAQGPLAAHGIELHTQAPGAAFRLSRMQAQDGATVVLGTKALWQGIDVPGPGVSCVFIDKLPLEPSSWPLVEAREEALGGGHEGFVRYRLPRALLLLRQGVGRLLRASTDRGVVVIADPGSVQYREALAQALSGYRVEVLAWEAARHRLIRALLGMGAARGHVSHRFTRDDRQAELFSTFNETSHATCRRAREPHHSPAD